MVRSVGMDRSYRVYQEEDVSSRNRELFLQELDQSSLATLVQEDVFVLWLNELDRFLAEKATALRRSAFRMRYEVGYFIALINGIMRSDNPSTDKLLLMHKVTAMEVLQVQRPFYWLYYDVDFLVEKFQFQAGLLLQLLERMTVPELAGQFCDSRKLLTLCIEAFGYQEEHQELYLRLASYDNPCMAVSRLCSPDVMRAFLQDLPSTVEFIEWIPKVLAVHKLFGDKELFLIWGIWKSLPPQQKETYASNSVFMSEFLISAYSSLF